MRFNPKARLDSSQLMNVDQKRPGGHTYASRFDRMTDDVDSEKEEELRRRAAIVRRFRRSGGLQSR